jgi:hypothetical protein
MHLNPINIFYTNVFSKKVWKWQKCVSSVSNVHFAGVGRLSMCHKCVSQVYYLAQCVSFIHKLLTIYSLIVFIFIFAMQVV